MLHVALRFPPIFHGPVRRFARGQARTEAVSPEKRGRTALERGPIAAAVGRAPRADRPRGTALQPEVGALQPLVARQLAGGAGQDKLSAFQDEGRRCAEMLVRS